MLGFGDKIHTSSSWQLEELTVYGYATHVQTRSLHLPNIERNSMLRIPFKAL